LSKRTIRLQQKAFIKEAVSEDKIRQDLLHDRKRDSMISDNKTKAHVYSPLSVTQHGMDGTIDETRVRNHGLVSPLL
jgi:hypothetical protein